MPLTRVRHVAAIFLALLAPAIARADESTAREKEACVAASEQGQTLRDDGKFRGARAQFAACAAAACPGIVRRDCEKWLGELDAAQPTVVLAARDPKGNDIVGARVSVDGAPLVDHLDGRPVPVDPGEHAFRYEAPGAATTEQRAIVRVGEKNRILTVTMPFPLGSATQAASAASGASSRPARPPLAVRDAAAEPSTSRDAPSARIPTTTWIFGGVGAAALASFAYFGISGKNDVASLRDSCAPNCAQSDVDAAHAKLVVADVSLAIGVGATGLATWFFFSRGSDGRAHVQAGVAPVPGGAVGAFGARF